MHLPKLIKNYLKINQTIQKTYFANFNLINAFVKYYIN
jgi:hypothetical protein